MRRVLILGIAGALIASAAQGQTTVSKCGWEFGKWVCRSQTTQPQPSAFETGQRAYEATVARRPFPQAQGPDVRDEVSELVRAGQCDDARLTAERAGDRDLAAAVARVCRPN